MAIQMKAFMDVDKVSNDRMSFFINLNCLEFVFSFSCFFYCCFYNRLKIGLFPQWCLVGNGQVCIKNCAVYWFGMPFLEKI